MNIDDILEIQEIFEIDTAQKTKKSLMENFIFCAVSPIFLVWKFSVSEEFRAIHTKFTHRETR